MPLRADTYILMYHAEKVEEIQQTDWLTHIMLLCSL